MNYKEHEVFHYFCSSCGKPLPPGLADCELRCYHCGKWAIFRNGELIKPQKEAC